MSKKPKPKNKKPSKRWEKYKGEKSQNCPRCGPGIFLAQHKNRQTCGKCGYTVFNESKKEEKK